MGPQTPLLTEKHFRENICLELTVKISVMSFYQKDFQKPTIQSREGISFHDQSKKQFFESRMVFANIYPVALFNCSSRLSSILKVHVVSTYYFSVNKRKLLFKCSR